MWDDYEMLVIRVKWKVLGKYILVWLLLFWWFIYNRIVTRNEPKDKIFYDCKCGEYYLTDDSDWLGWHRWKNWLYTATDVHPSCGEYSGEDWVSHSICWRCGRYHCFSDSSC